MTPKSIKILIAEDESIIALDIKRTLSKMHYNIIGVVSTGEAAIKRVEEEQPDLILMDITLKGEMTGIETAGEIHKTRHIPIIYLTGLNDENTVNKIKEQGYFGYILKPFDENVLLNKIAELLENN